MFAGRVDKKDVPKTAFNTRIGTFVYLRMEMALKWVSAAFQRFMTEIFADLMYQGALDFIIDILIYSEKWEQHIKLVNKVLKRLAEHNLEAKVGKWHFREKEIKCVGFVVSYKCRKPDTGKVRAMKELQPPKTKEDVISVLGLVAFYREFIRIMSGEPSLIQKLMEKNVLF